VTLFVDKNTNFKEGSFGIENKLYFDKINLNDAHQHFIVGKVLDFYLERLNEFMSYLPVCKYLAKRLLSATGQTLEKEDILAYSIEVLIINAVNVTLTILLGFLLGVLEGTIACLFVAFLFRHTAGGAHSVSPFRCAVITILIFPLIALSAEFLTRLTDDFYLNALQISAIIICGFLFAYLAPVDSTNAPILSTHRRRKLKALSIMAYISVALFIMYSKKYKYLDDSVCLSIILCVIWSVFVMSKYGNNFFKYVDGINKERR